MTAILRAVTIPLANAEIEEVHDALAGIDSGSPVAQFVAQAMNRALFAALEDGIDVEIIVREVL